MFFSMEMNSVHTYCYVTFTRCVLRGQKETNILHSTECARTLADLSKKAVYCSRLYLTKVSLPVIFCIPPMFWVERPS